MLNRTKISLIILSSVILITCGGGGGGGPTEPETPPPSANFTATPTTGNQPLEVTFTSTSTGTITSHAWNVDGQAGPDGTTAAYTHTYNDAGTYTAVLTVAGPGGSNTKTVADMITVQSSAPVITTPATQTTDEDTAVTFTLSATDPNGQAVTYAIVDNPSNGTASISGDQATYTPNANFYGTDSFTYQATNGTYTSDVATVTITIAGTDDGDPTTNDVSVTTDEDTAVVVNLDATEIDGDNYSFAIISNPSNGTLGSVSGSTVTYTPNQDWHGTDTFTFEATDDRTARSNVATATITVASVNDAPVANDVTAQMDENKEFDRFMPVTITFDASDVEGETLTYSVVSDPSNGSLSSVTGNQVTYTPNQDWNGTDTFTYKANDGTADSNTATVTITVTAVNDAPVSSDENITTDEDTGIRTGFSSSDVDSGDTLTYSVVANPSNGTVTIDNANSEPGLYTPNQDWNGTDTFTYKANDGELDSNVSTVTITVAAVNDAPTTEDVSTTIDENRTASRSTGIALQGSDVDGDNLTYTVVSGPSNGNASIAGSILTYAANQDWNGTETITYKANDGTVDSNTSTVTITVNSVNDAPVTQNQSASTNEDTAVATTLSVVDVDTQQGMTRSIVSNPSNGSVVLSGSGSQIATYTPNANWNGTDTFTWKANDGTVDSNTSTVTVTVSAVNDAPVANDVTTSTNETRFISVDITLDATDVEGDAITYSIVSNPSNGSLGSISGATVTYTPSTDWNGTDTFTYKANDGSLDSNTATVTITVDAVNDAPTTSAVSASTNEDTAVDITLSGADVDSGDTLTYSVVATNNGSVSISGATATYTPNANWNGTDTFTYKANDGTVDSNTSTVTVTVSAVNDAPVSSAVSASTDEDIAKAITLDATDVEGDAITYSIVSNPSNGSLGSVSGASVTYTQTTANWNGTDTFTYKANDGTADGNTATVTITVAAVNDAPVSSAVSASTNEDTAKAITLIATDVEGSSLTYSIVSNPSNGSLGSISGASVTYTPTANWNGTDTFTYKANDGTADSNTATVTFTVASIQDVPTTSAVSASTNEDTAVDITLSGADVDSGDTLTYSVVANPSNGTLGNISGSNNTVTYTPTANWNGTDTFTYKVNDGTADSNTSTVTVTVSAVNDVPVATNVTKDTVNPSNDFPKWGSMNAPLDITLTATDVENDNLTYTVVTAPDSGSVTISGAVATYTPNDDFVPGFTNEGKQNAGAEDTFTYKANDGTNDSNTATVGSISLSGTNILFPNRDLVHNGSTSSEQKNITKGTNVADGVRFWSNMGGVDVDWEIGLYDSNKNLIQALKTVDARIETQWANQGFSRDSNNPNEYRLDDVQFNTAGDGMFLGVVTNIPSGTFHTPSFTEFSDEPFSVYHISWPTDKSQSMIPDPNGNANDTNQYNWVKGARYRDIIHYRAGGDAWDFDLYKGSSKVQDLVTTNDTEKITIELEEHSAGDDYFVRVSDDSGNLLRDSDTFSIVDGITYPNLTANQEFNYGNVAHPTVIVRIEVEGYFISGRYQVWRNDLDNLPNNQPVMVVPNAFVDGVNDTTRSESITNSEGGYIDLHLTRGTGPSDGTSGYFHQGKTYKIKIFDNDDTTSERNDNSHWSPVFKIAN